jgi:hypothetical protein
LGKIVDLEAGKCVDARPNCQSIIRKLHSVYGEADFAKALEQLKLDEIRKQRVIALLKGGRGSVASANSRNLGAKPWMAKQTSTDEGRKTTNENSFNES